ncbi:MAG: ComF family protein [Actinomycetota bacterium]|nr:ComF family protein [Actinomycetota bacterium]
MNLNPIPLKGNWEEGWALDLNTICKDAKENDLFIVNRTEIGEHLYQLKYFGDTREVEVIGDVAADFIRDNLSEFNLSAIIPVPPSKLDREFQPVYMMAQYIGKKLDIPVDFDYLEKTENTPQLVNLKDADKRKEILKDVFKVKDNRYKDKSILLFDDIYSSGETLKAITSTLLSNNYAGSICVLTITKTRINR